MINMNLSNCSINTFYTGILSRHYHGEKFLKRKHTSSLILTKII